MASVLGATCVGALVSRKRPIISVPDTASVRTALQVMVANDVVAVPVSAPPGKWLGAGASFIVDGDKQYIGMVSMVDVAMHLADTRCAADALDQPVVGLIGASPEGLSMWVYDPRTRLADVLEPLSKGVHRLLVRAQAGSIAAEEEPPAGKRAEVLEGKRHEGELQRAREAEVEAATEAEAGELRQGRLSVEKAQSQYFFLSQTDVVAFLLSRMDELGPVVQRTLVQLCLVDPLFPPLAVSECESVLATLRLMRKAPGIRAVAIVADNGGESEVTWARAPQLSPGPPSPSSTGVSQFGVEGASPAPASSSPRDPCIIPVAYDYEPTEPSAGGSGGPDPFSASPFAAAEAMREQDRHPATWRRGGRLLGTLSVTDLRGLSAQQLAALGTTKVGQFLASLQGEGARAPVACRPDAPLALAMALAVTNHVHRVWVSTEDDDLVGVVSLSDIIATVRRANEGRG